MAALLWLVVLPCAEAAAPAGQWWNLSYNFRRTVNIPAGTTALPANYAVSVVFNHSSEVGMSRSLATGNDVRVVRWNGTGWTELNRIADADTAWNTTTTRIWFQTAAQINANVTDDNYYIYYNNPAAGAPPATAEGNIFMLYDDFSSGAISSTRWTATNGTPVDAGVAQLNTNGSLTSKSSFGIDTIWETRARLSTTFGSFDYWGASGTETLIIFPVAVYLRFQSDNNSHQSTTNALDLVGAGTKTFSPVTPTSFQTYAFTREGSSLSRFLINGTVVTSFDSGVPASALVAGMENNQGGEKMFYDWVRVRRYRNPEPGLSLSSAQQPAGGVDHFTIVHDRQGINCLAETITVHARNASNNPVTNYSQPITLTTTTGKGTWSKVTGSGAFSDGTANDGVATYTWASGESSATFTLYYPSGTPTFDIEAFQTGTPAIDDDDTEGTITFSPSGFTLTSSALSNPPPASITPFTATQTAGTAFNVHLAAYGQTPTDSVCGVIEDYAGAKSLSIGTGYVNPVSGTLQASLVATSVTFTNGQGVASVKYKDVGRIIISIADGSVVGSTGEVTFRPGGFLLSNINLGGTAHPTPLPTDATGVRFARAGAAFNVTVTARDTEGSTTPNYGRETPAQSVELTSTLVAPSGGNNPAVTIVSAPTFNNGVGTGSFSWPEVGIIRLTPQVAGASYLGTGNVTGTISGNVGRFYPDTFQLTSNTPIFQTACTGATAASSYTYLGQPLGYSVAPIVTATAKAVGGATTLNYRTSATVADNFARIGTSPLSKAVYLPIGSAFTLDATAAPAPGIGSATNGVFAISLSPTSGVSVARTTAPRAPVSTPMTLTVQVTDVDMVASSDLVIGNTGGIAFSSTSMHRYGRLAFRNAVGSELIPLAMPLRAEYYLSDAAGFVNNVDEACTTAPGLGLGDFAGNLGSGETCAINGGSCAPSAPASQQLRAMALAGDFNLWLNTPGNGNDGTVIVTAMVPAWLQFNWGITTPGVMENPRGIATFGVYQGSVRRIYQRERVR